MSDTEGRSMSDAEGPRKSDTEAPRTTDTDGQSGASETPVASTVAQRVPGRLGGGRRLKVFADLGHPIAWGFLATVGALIALALATSVSALSTVVVSIGVALFIALALDPLVRWLEARRLPRGASIAVVFAGFFLVFAGLLALVIPVAITQVGQFASSVPGYLNDLRQSDWFKDLSDATGQGSLYASLLAQAQAWLSNPANLLSLAGGALAVGTGVVNGVSGSLIVLVLTLYFLASLDSMKKALYSLAPAYGRGKLADLTTQISDSVGGYVAGMAILAATNAVFSFILLSVLGVPFPALLGVVALVVTFIPLIGPVLFWIIGSVVTAVTSEWWVALVFVVVYFAYMQVEAYVATPRVMTKAVDIPGSLVLIGAMVGGTLLGLLGALVAVPVTAGLLLIIQQVYIPRQDARVTPED